MVNEFVNKYIANPKHLMNITLEITSECNLRCCHCYVCDRFSNQDCQILSLSTIEKIIDEAFDLNAITVCLTGGEPMSHPGFIDIIKMIKSKGFVLFLKTNGTLINTENIEYLKTYIDGITLSRYGFTAKTYENVTGIKHSYERYCNAIDLLKKYRIPYKENAILLKENELELDQFLISNMKIEHYISEHKDSPYAARHRPSDAALHKYYYEYFKKEGMDLPEIFSGSINEKAVCNCGTCSLTINPNGDVVPCTNFNYTLGNIPSQSLKSIWGSDKKHIFL